jgi:hypothetical protein
MKIRFGIILGAFLLAWIARLTPAYADCPPEVTASSTDWISNVGNTMTWNDSYSILTVDSVFTGGVYIVDIQTSDAETCSYITSITYDITPATSRVGKPCHQADFSPGEPGPGHGWAYQMYTSAGNFTATFHMVNCDTVSGGGLIRPFSLTDENVDFSGGLYDSSLFIDPLGPNAAELVAPHDPAVAYAWAKTSDAYVIAAGDGTITNIEAFYASECSLLGFLLPDSCLIASPDDNISNPATVIMYLYEASTQDAFKVTLTLDSGEELVYWARKANQFVNVGIHIDGGCIIGLAMPTQPLSSGAIFQVVRFLLGIGGSQVQAGTVEVGLAFVGKKDLEDEVPLNDYAPVVAELGQYASPDEACNIDPRFSGCMVNDPELRDSSQWQTDGQVQWFDTPGIELDPGGSVYQQLNLQSDTSYTVTISLFPSPTILAGKPAEVTIYLGDQTQSFSINPGDSGQYEMTVTPSPDLGGQFYTVRVANTGQAWFVLSGICVGEEGRQLVSSDCLVSNPGFDFNLDGWTPSGGIEWTNGKAWVPSEDTLTQTINLPQGDWTISVEVFVWSQSGWDGTGDISLDITWPDGTTTDEVATIPTWNLPGNLGFPAIPQVLTDDFTAETDLTGNLVLSPTTSGNEDIVGLKIDHVCIIEQGSSTGGFTASCSVVSEPSEDTIGVWIAYLWGQLNRFFQCDLMILLNKILALMREFFRTISFISRYFVASSQYGGDWASHYLFPWLAGHFRNMAIGQVTTINTDSGANFWDVLIALINGVVSPIVNSVTQVVGLLTSLLAQAAGLVFTIMSGIITLFLQLITQLLMILKLGQELLASLITAYNSATPTPIPGAPDCSNPQSGPFCIALWILDNTIFSGPGAAIIPILVGILSIHLILWVVSDLRNTALNLGQVS